jgi:hypothetical protein
VFHKPWCSAKEKSGVDCLPNIVKNSAVLTSRILWQKQRVFPTFYTQSTPDFSLRNTMVSGTRRVCTLKMSPQLNYCIWPKELFFKTPTTAVYHPRQKFLLGCASFAKKLFRFKAKRSATGSILLCIYMPNPKQRTNFLLLFRFPSDLSASFCLNMKIFAGNLLCLFLCLCSTSDIDAQFCNLKIIFFISNQGRVRIRIFVSVLRNRSTQGVTSFCWNWR